ncbi:MAG TPA: right-handed parallel beta-helix repeat-containing protein, partial [Firmicutes bacterium]|nr:right-handed parallel beta-helix repeat-containing protein [Bacillota bacterium]
MNSSPLIQDNRDISYQQIKIDALGRIVRSSGTGIYLQGGSNPLIRRNTFIGNQGNIILIAGKGATPVTPLPKLGGPAQLRQRRHRSGSLAGDEDDV